MCRWLAYSGPPIFLEELIVKPSHSLLVQSRFAQENYIHDIDGLPEGSFPTNGDGFGIGWYGGSDEPGLYREWRPAWSDQNLLNLSAHIKSGLFLAHLRAAIHGVVQRTNSHPFAHRNWLFQHNGEISGFGKIKRELQFKVDEELFPQILGTTDSETAFYLALTFGLMQDPKKAFEYLIGMLEETREAAGIEDPIRFTCAATDGVTIYALRYSTDEDSKTLYVNSDRLGVEEILGEEVSRKDAQIVLSEPLDDRTENWHKVPESSFLTVNQGDIKVESFSPSA
jgi:glutamine amidotransferase